MKKINLIVLLFIGVLLVGCDKDFEEVNQNPNDPTSVPSDLLLGNILRSTGDNMYSTFSGGDMGECWSQHWAKVQYNDESRYTPRESVINFVWRDFYIEVLQDADAMYKLAGDEGNLVSQGIAATLKAYTFLWLTDLYGDIPFSQALQANEDIINPAYDSQADVYAGCIALLDEAMAKLNSANGSIDSSQDILYGGDISLWKKFAATTKFRALMRISGVSAPGSQLQTLVNSGNLFSSRDEEAKMIYLEAAPNANPIYETVVFGTRNEWKVCDQIVDRLDGTLGFPIDSRLSVYVAESEEGELRGKPVGIADVPSVEYSYANVSPIGAMYLDPTLPAMFLGYTELQFLLAEAAHKGYISGDASTYYQEGIASSFAENGVDMGGYYSGIVVFSATLADEQIATQKWLSLFGQGFEAWTEWRRTGYPVLPLAIDNDPSVNSIPTRYTYPVLEQSLNATNYDVAVSNLSGGDELTSKVWWDNN